MSASVAVKSSVLSSLTSNSRSVSSNVIQPVCTRASLRIRPLVGCGGSSEILPAHHRSGVEMSRNSEVSLPAMRTLPSLAVNVRPPARSLWSRPICRSLIRTELPSVAT